MWQRSLTPDTGCVYATQGISLHAFLLVQPDDGFGMKAETCSYYKQKVFFTNKVVD
jgi:hypothetical protein